MMISFNMPAKVIIFSSILLLTSAVTWDHPLKMSFSNLNIRMDGFAELETHVFLDDITIHMQHLYNLEEVDFANLKTNGTEALQDYIKSRFYFEQDSQKLDLRIDAVSYSRNGLALVLNMRTTKPLDLSKELTLINTMLCDATQRQRHHVRHLGQQYQFGCFNPSVKLVPAANK